MVNRSTGPGTGTGAVTGFWFSEDQKWHTLTKGTCGGRGLVRTDLLKVCVMIDTDVVDRYVSVESFCVSRTGTNKKQSGHDLKTPKE